ncbi:unannotated protein [freshwater metagenome]|uniref:Unannotated protein n=1 Tax=freshwater metagenome TaxID=449393 RepID=A0A6J7HBB0_9ZZZZ
MPTQHLGDREHEIGGRGALWQLTAELEADDPRDEHRNRLAEHRGLGFDAAHAPAQHSQAVHHGGVRIGADNGVGVGLSAAGHDDASEVLDVHLMDDARAGRHDLELLECALAPAQELVTLTVAFVLELDVALLGIGGTEEVRDDGVVDDEL